MKLLPGLLLAVIACNEPGPKPGASSAGADCVKAADQLATFELGPGAKPEQRAQAVAKHRSACESAVLTPAEASCIAKATNTWAAIDCAPRMFPNAPRPTPALADCKAATLRMREAVLAEMPKDSGSGGVAMVDKMLPVMEAACVEDKWPAKLIACMSNAKSGDMAAFQACNDLMPRTLQLSLGERLKPIVRGQASDPKAGSAAPAATP